MPLRCLFSACSLKLQPHVLAAGGHEVDSNMMLTALRNGIHAAQQLIIHDDTNGTLTTLVACLIAPEAPAVAEKHSRWHFGGSTGGSDDGTSSMASSSSDLEGQQQEAGSSENTGKWSWPLVHGKHKGKKQRQVEDGDQKAPRRFVVCSLMIGDSPAYVWRHRTGVVEEVAAPTSAGPLMQHR
jgi:hypothetical protein